MKRMTILVSTARPLSIYAVICGKVPWTVYKLNSKEYEDLQRQLKDDVELRGYVDDRVR